MSKKFNTVMWALICLQLLTAVFHSLSFFAEQVAKNETEKQLIDLATNYRPDAGMGFNPSLISLFTGLSLCYTLINIFGALLNAYFLKKKVDANLWRGVIVIQQVIFGGVFLAMSIFTFLPPIVCSGLIFLSLFIVKFLFPKTSK